MDKIVSSSAVLRSGSTVIAIATSMMACHLAGLDSRRVAEHLAMPSVFLTWIGSLVSSWWLVGLGARLAGRWPGVGPRLYAVVVVALAVMAMFAMSAVHHASDAASDREHLRATSNPTNR